MRPLLFCCLLAVSLCGCARTYVITLQNGRQVMTASKPRLEKGNYVFKDAEGKPAYVPAGRVREVAPASMVKESQSKSFKSGR